MAIADQDNNSSPRASNNIKVASLAAAANANCMNKESRIGKCWRKTGHNFKWVPITNRTYDFIYFLQNYTVTTEETKWSSMHGWSPGMIQSWETPILQKSILKTSKMTTWPTPSPVGWVQTLNSCFSLSRKILYVVASRIRYVFWWIPRCWKVRDKDRYAWE